MSRRSLLFLKPGHTQKTTYKFVYFLVNVKTITFS